MHTRLARRIGVVVASLVFVIALGCDKKPEITSYEVPRDKNAPVAPPVASSESAPAAKAEPARMIAAAVLRDGQAWYFKVTGTEATVEKVADDIDAFIKSLKLPEDQSAVVTWEVPEGWKQGPARMMREATLILPEGEPPVELAISKLTVQGEETEYLLANINRWRGQLGLKDVEKLDEAAGVKVVELDGGKAWVFDGVGEMAAGAMMPPMMGGNAPFAGGVTPPESPAHAVETEQENAGRMIATIMLRGDTAWFIKALGPKAEVDKVANSITEFMKSVELPANAPSAIEWKGPQEWKDGGQRMMREATFIVSDAKPPLEVAISKLSFPGNENEYLLSNINRWRGQLGLEPVQEVNEAAGVTTVELEGGKAWMFDASGELVGGGMTPPMMGGTAPFAGGSPAAPTNSAPATDEEKE